MHGGTAVQFEYSSRSRVLDLFIVDLLDYCSIEGTVPLYGACSPESMPHRSVSIGHRHRPVRAAGLGVAWPGRLEPYGTSIYAGVLATHQEVAGRVPWAGIRSVARCAACSTLHLVLAFTCSGRFRAGCFEGDGVDGGRPPKGAG